MSRTALLAVPALEADADARAARASHTVQASRRSPGAHASPAANGGAHGVDGAAIPVAAMPSQMPPSLRAAPRAPVASDRQVAEAIASPGSPLPEPLRQRFETEYGVDFGRVRLHDDDAAHRATRSAGALAATWGEHVLFAPGRLAPRTPAGLNLLAHELAHVRQAAFGMHGAAGALHARPDPGAATPTVKWYQEAIDQVELSNRRMDEDRKSGGFVLTPPYHELKKAILELCEAVDTKDADAARKKLAALLGHKSLWVHLQLLSRALLTELSARMFEMGLEAEAEQLRQRYASESREGPYNDDIYGSQRRVQYWERLVQGLPVKPEAESAAAVAAGMRRHARVFLVLRQAYLAIDWEGVERNRASSRGGMTIRPWMTPLEVYEALRSTLELWHRQWSTYVESVLATVRRDLESAKPSGSGATLLKALQDALLGELMTALFPEDEKQNIAGSEAFEATKTTMSKPGQGRIDDVFEPGDTKRSVPVTTYDPEQEWARELRSTVAASFRARRTQVDTLARVYGVGAAIEKRKDPAKQQEIADDAADNASAIQALSAGRLRLDSDDDWREFLRFRLNALVFPPQGSKRKALTDGQALAKVVRLLFDYLAAFTVHARFTNLYDFGRTPYFNRPFPRALTGQLVQDCGVYAMRAAYILSLVRDDLNLKFYFVRLPAHVSLVITGAEGSDLPTIVIENNQAQVLSPDYLAERRAQWEGWQDPDAKPGDKAPPKDETQFIGELAAGDFIRGPADMPFRVTELPKPKGSAAQQQAQLWALYQGPAMADVFGPASRKKGGDSANFHQQYLALTERAREVHNEVFVPFWNDDAPPVWKGFVARLEAPGTDAKAQPASARASIRVAELTGHLDAYTAALKKTLEPVNKRLAALHAEEERVGRLLRRDPQLGRSDVRTSIGARAGKLLQYHWEWHLDQVARLKTRLAAKKADDTEDVAQIKQGLEPGWAAADAEPLRRVD